MNKICVNAYQLESGIEMILELCMTPYISVHTAMALRPYTLPEEFIEDGVIILNVDPSAVTGYHLDKENGILYFSAKFRGRSMDCKVPLEMATVVYGAGTKFSLVLPPSLVLIDEQGRDILLEYDNGMELAGITPKVHVAKAVPKPPKAGASFLKVVK